MNDRAGGTRSDSLSGKRGIRARKSVCTVLFMLTLTPVQLNPAIRRRYQRLEAVRSAAVRCQY
jgi:hypothetical protein